mmetsp:Transcript_48678/g.136111  ORF Transcript_48678/g.136111 Transcript_48678/m.136111 type:complete len:266 (-) Transcript_48678:476-1273(-)
MIWSSRAQRPLRLRRPPRRPGVRPLVPPRKSTNRGSTETSRRRAELSAPAVPLRLRPVPPYRRPPPLPLLSQPHPLLRRPRPARTLRLRRPPRLGKRLWCHPRPEAPRLGRWREKFPLPAFPSVPQLPGADQQLDGALAPCRANAYGTWRPRPSPWRPPEARLRLSFLPHGHSVRISRRAGLRSRPFPTMRFGTLRRHGSRPRPCVTHWMSAMRKSWKPKRAASSLPLRRPPRSASTMSWRQASRNVCSATSARRSRSSWMRSRI